MPKPSDYTPARRYAMQAVMWLILGGTVALAAVVSRSARHATRVQLAPQPITEGAVSLRLPVKWRPGPRGEDPRVVAAASDPSSPSMGASGGAGAGRAVEVLCDRLNVPVSPLQYLVENYGLHV